MKRNSIALLAALLIAGAAGADDGTRHDNKTAEDVAGESRTSYYDIHGLTAAAVQESLFKSPLGRKGERVTLGQNLFRIRYTYQVTFANGVCRVSDYKVTHDNEFRMPRWVDKLNAPAVLQRDWEDFYARVQAHEDTHREIGLRALHAIEAHISSVQPQASCADITAGIASAFAAGIARQRAENEAFDTSEAGSARHMSVGAFVIR